MLVNRSKKTNQVNIEKEKVISNLNRNLIKPLK